MSAREPVAAAPPELTPALVARRLEQVRALHALMLSLRAITPAPGDRRR